MTEIVDGLDGAQREHVAAPREAGRVFWIDVALGDATASDMGKRWVYPRMVTSALDARNEVESTLDDLAVLSSDLRAGRACEWRRCGRSARSWRR